MVWNWQKSGWPDFRYDDAQLAPLEQRFLLSSGEVLGAVQHVNSAERDQLRIDLLSDEAMKASAIEGEMLDRRSVQSSLRRHLGLEPDNYCHCTLVDQNRAQIFPVKSMAVCTLNFHTVPPITILYP